MYGVSQDRALQFAPVEQALRFTVGAASPFWLVYGSVAAAGLALWSMARWRVEEDVQRLPAPALRLIAPDLPVVEPEAKAVQAEEAGWPSAAELAQLTQYSGPVEIDAEEALTRPVDELAEEVTVAEPAPKPKKRKAPPTSH
jgi:hypothetical protein